MPGGWRASAASNLKKKRALQPELVQILRVKESTGQESRLISTGKFDLLSKPCEEFQRLHGIIDFIPQVVRGSTERIERGEIIPDIDGDQTAQHRKILFVPVGKLMTPGHGFGWIQLNHLLNLLLRSPNELYEARLNIGIKSVNSSPSS